MVLLLGVIWLQVHLLGNWDGGEESSVHVEILVPVRVRDKSVADEKDRIASNLAKNDLSAKFKVFGKKITRKRFSIERWSKNKSKRWSIFFNFKAKTISIVTQKENYSRVASFQDFLKFHVATPVTVWADDLVKMSPHLVTLLRSSEVSFSFQPIRSLLLGHVTARTNQMSLFGSIVKKYDKPPSFLIK